MTDFATFFHIVQLVKSLPFHIPEAVKKVPLSVSIGSNPPGDQMQPVNVHRASIFSVAREDKGAQLLYPVLAANKIPRVSYIRMCARDNDLVRKNVVLWTMWTGYFLRDAALVKSFKDEY